MKPKTFEVRVCESCELRYPLVGESAHGTRCPVCMGRTRRAIKRRLSFEGNGDFAPAPSPGKKGGVAVLLDNIRSAGNVGSIFRSAEGFGFRHAYLCGITATPEMNAVRKTSLGAEDSVPWSYHKDAVKLVKGLKTEGWKVYGLEEGMGASPISIIKKPKSDAVLMVGNEIVGVDPELLSLCDEVFYIPMRGEKKSFNVAVAFGIAAYCLTYDMSFPRSARGRAIR
ncbi:MAG: RNA methyltransferase [Anaerolineales bacterium]|nr:RNA methyltransferase [Anaerolineales bacterium]